MRQRNCTIKDVAKLAGVSVGTASKAINNIYVRPEAKARVDQAVAELHYIPNAMARGLKNQSTKTIGVMIPDISKSINNIVLRGISNSCKSCGYSMIVSDFNMSQEAVLKILSTYIEKKVDGIIYASNSMSKEIEQAFVDCRIPIVLIMTTAGNNKFPKLTIDNEAASKYMTQQLINAGHRRILFLGGEIKDENAGLPRVTGYCNALKEAGIPIDETLIEQNVFEFEYGYNMTRKKLEERVHFTAVYGAADLIAMGAIKALKEFGLKVPEDVSVAGFDGIDSSRYVVPELSTIQQPLLEYGLESVKLLVKMIEEDIPGEDIDLQWKLQKGGTIAPVKE